MASTGSASGSGIGSGDTHDVFGGGADFLQQAVLSLDEPDLEALMDLFTYAYRHLFNVLIYFVVGTCSQVPGSATWRRFSTCKPNPLAKRDNFGSAASLYSQTRWASQATAVKETDPSGGKISIGPKSKQIKEDDKDDGLVYEGPISSTIKKVKLLSLSTCCLSVSLGPVITFMTSPDMNVILKGGVASTVIFVSATTTAALHWFVSPYIHKLRWRQGADSFEAEIMSWLATPLKKTIKFADIRPAETNRPYVTFRADGNFYFVDADHFANKALLERLTPKHPQESAFKNL